MQSQTLTPTSPNSNQHVSSGKLLRTLAFISLPFLVTAIVLFILGLPLAAIVLLGLGSIPGGLLLFTFLSYMEDSLK